MVGSVLGSSEVGVSPNPARKTFFPYGQFQGCKRLWTDGRAAVICISPFPPYLGLPLRHEGGVHPQRVAGVIVGPTSCPVILSVHEEGERDLGRGMYWCKGFSVRDRFMGDILEVEEWIMAHHSRATAQGLLRPPCYRAK